MTNKYSKKHFVIGSVLIYAVLILILVLVNKKNDIEKPCSGHSPCVRFCCDVRKKCNEKYIREHFNASFPEEYWIEANETEEYKILFGNPTCKLSKLPKSVKWSFTVRGDLVHESEYVDSDRYCFEQSSDSLNDTGDNEWELYVCKELDSWRVANIVLLVSTVLLLSAPLSIYAYFAELRTVNGKCLMILNSTILASYVGLLLMESVHIDIMLEEDRMLIVIFGLLFSFLWMTVITFDVWWNFRDFQATSNDKIRFKWYCVYVLGFFSLMIAPVLMELLIHHFVKNVIQYIFLFLFFALIATALVDICFIGLTAYKIFQMSRTLSSANTRFEYEKERFWTVVELFGIMLICWPLEIGSWHSLEQESAIVVSDIIMFFSALLIFAILILQENVKRLVFRKYESLRASE